MLDSKAMPWSAMFMLLLACRNSAPSGSDAASGVSVRTASRPLTSDFRLQPAAEDRCANCGMRIAEHSHWAGALVTKDGTTYLFCTSRCTLTAVNEPQRVLGSSAPLAPEVRVADYLRPGETLDAKVAYFVVDSTVRGPMGAELLAVSREEDAKVLALRHGGRIVRLTDLDMDLLRNLSTGRTQP